MSGFCKYNKRIKQVSYDNGVTWIDVTPVEYKKGAMIESNSTDCGYIGTFERWVNSGTTCQGYDKYNLQVKQISYDGTSWTSTTDTQLGSLIQQNSSDCGYSPTPYSNRYLTFVAIENCDFGFNYAATGNSPVQYSIDNGSTWVTIRENQATPIITAGNKIIWKGGVIPNGENGIGSFWCSRKFNVEGNPMSLIYGDNFIGQTSLSEKDYAFSSLFSSCLKLVSAQNLVLNSTTLSIGCYKYMFSGCTSLTTAPSLSAATTLVDDCYYGMFADCTSLINAPEIPATTVAMSCCLGMFTNCRNLVKAPSKLHATTLANGCYALMFADCTSLTTAPILPAATLAADCYWQMFMGCTSLNNITCLATDISAEYCTSEWVAGVGSSGTFTKAASMNDWNRYGTSGIPEGWSVQNA